MVQDLKKGTAELLVLSLIEDRARHGYEIAKLIGASPDGELNSSSAAAMTAINGSKPGP